MSRADLSVLAVTDFYLPRSGGVERVVHETARRLPGQGIAVEVLTRRLEPGAQAEETLDGVRTWRVGPGPRSLPGELRGLGRAVRSWEAGQLGRFDLVHAHLTLTALPLLAPLRRRGIPLVATFYGPWHREYLEETTDPDVPSRWPKSLRGLARPVVARCLRTAQRRVLGAASLRIVLSQHSLRELADLGYNVETATEVVPGGVDVERFRPADAGVARRRLGLADLGGPLLVAVRRLVPRMGLQVLIEALGRLSGRYPTIGLAIGGTGPLLARLEEEAALRGLGRRVRLLGPVSEDDLPWLYAAADVAVLPTRALEGFGLPVLEAWSCGVPVVGTAVGALEETVARLDASFVAREPSAEALASAIARAIEARSPALSERARCLALSYGWEPVTARLGSLYRRTARLTSLPRREAEPGGHAG